MSSILEALRKLEEEKAARRGGVGNIAGKVAATGRRTRQRSSWLLAGAMAAVAVIAIIATYAAMGGFSARPAKPVTGSGDTITPAGTKPASQKDIPAPRDGSPPSRATQQQLQAPAPAGTTGAVKGASLPPSAAQPAAPRPTPQKANDARENVPSPQMSPEARFPAMSITGIAWQKDNAARLAVVNGISVAEGTVVEGASVTEILPDRVRFSLNGSEFEAFLGKQRR